MIYTVTFNPSIDYVVNVDNFTAGKVNRVSQDFKYPGGKGINVSRVLNNLRIKNKALGFIGGFTGEYIVKSLESEGVDTDFIKVKDDTRINVKLKSKDETEINGAGPDLSIDDLNKLKLKINQLTQEDTLVLAGSIQKTLPRDTYSQLQESCCKNNVKVVIDTTGEALTSTLKYKPFLIKPNRDELAEIFNVELNSIEEIITYARKLLHMGAENIIISMAGDGALLITPDEVYHGTSPKKDVKNSVGAGDSLIAGFLSSYSKDKNIIEAFKWGIASGSATAFSLDLCKKEDVLALLTDIKINKI